MELALYNGALSGLSRDGTQYFYQNPLESDGSHTPLGLASLPLLHDERLAPRRLGRRLFLLDRRRSARRAPLRRQHRQRQRRRHDGRGSARRPTIRGPARWRSTIDPDAPATFALKLRIPGWARTATIAVNGEPVDAERRDRGYVEIRREWTAGDRVALDLPMPVERVYAHPKVKMDVGRVALKRGPLVYCLEQVDNPVRRSACSGCRATQSQKPPNGRPLRRDRRHSRRCGGGRRRRMGWRALPRRPTRQATAKLTAVPYYLWNNRGPNRCSSGFRRLSAGDAPRQSARLFLGGWASASASRQRRRTAEGVTIREKLESTPMHSRKTALFHQRLDCQFAQPDTLEASGSLADFAQVPRENTSAIRNERPQRESAGSR